MTDIDRDNEQFNQGVTHTVELLSKTIGAEGWVAGDGSEDYDCDLALTLLNILAAKGLYDPDNAEYAVLIDRKKIAGTMRRLADRMSAAGTYLLETSYTDPKATDFYVRLLGVQSFMRLDAEEIESGKCCCQHVPDDDMPTPCKRCDGTTISEFYRAAVGDPSHASTSKTVA